MNTDRTLNDILDEIDSHVCEILTGAKSFNTIIPIEIDLRTPEIDACDFVQRAVHDHALETEKLLAELWGALKNGRRLASQERAVPAAKPSTRDVLADYDSMTLMLERIDTARRMATQILEDLPSDCQEASSLIELGYLIDRINEHQNTARSSAQLMWNKMTCGAAAD